jgi:hypothetical protein
MNLNKEEVVDALISKGFYKFDASELLSRVDISNVTWVEDDAPNVFIPMDDETLDDQLREFNSNLIEMFGNAFATVTTGKIELWDGTEPTSCEWHNDLIEGWNLFALIYFNEAVPNNGGAVMFKSIIDDSEYIVYPSYGTCVLVNMQPWYFHRVVPQVKHQQRVVLNICYNIKF